MKTTTSASSSTLQEWSAFLEVLSENKTKNTPLLKPTKDAEKLIHHLNQQFKKQPVFPSFFLKYKYGRQLILSI